MNFPGSAEDQETVIVYGFTEREDFEQFRPPAGAVSSAQVDEYVSQVDQRLGARELPRSRWTKETFTYTIRAITD